jgi:hypothetical protein
MCSLFSKLKKLVIGAILCALGYGLYKAINTAKAQEKLFGILGEDLYLAILDKVRLLGDLLGWPIDFVRALLP